MVLVLPPCTDIYPPSLLLLEIQPSGVWKENPGDHGTRESKPRDNIEFGRSVDVVVEHRGEAGARFPTGSRNAVCSGSNWRREDLSGDKESDRVGTDSR